MKVTVPTKKLHDIIEESKRWPSKKTATRKQIQSLAGKLVHISQCVRPARKFMTRILHTLRNAPPTGHTDIDNEFHRDITWFVSFAHRFNGYLIFPEYYPPFHIECDSTLQGGGAFSDTHFYSIEYPAHLIKHTSHVAQLEAVNLVLAVKTLVPASITHRDIIVTTDNVASAYALNTGRTKDPILAACSRELWLFTALYQHKVTIIHAPGTHLVLSDALSRRHQSQTHAEIADKLVLEKSLQEITPLPANYILSDDL